MGGEGEGRAVAARATCTRQPKDGTQTKDEGRREGETRVATCHAWKSNRVAKCEVVSTTDGRDPGGPAFPFPTQCLRGEPVAKEHAHVAQTRIAEYTGLKQSWTRRWT
eukprot:scaffold64_cov338-Pavlova_lutheri.AAC.78